MDIASTLLPALEESRFVTTSDSEKTALEMFRDPCCLMIVHPGNSNTRPVECSQCQHLFCLQCAYELQKNKSACPTCRQGFNPRNANIKLMGILESLVVRCCYEPSGCKYTTKLSEIKSHEEKCQFATDELIQKHSMLKVTIPNLLKSNILDPDGFKNIQSKMKCNCGDARPFEIVYDLPSRDSKFYINSFICKICRNSRQATKDGILFCSACNFMACNACIKEIAKDTFKYSCEEGHLMPFAQDVSKIDSEYEFNAIICNNCQFFDVMERGCWHCKVCKFDCCMDCFNTPFTCSTGHHLRRSTKKPFYSCNRCKSSVPASDPGILSCKECEFALCDKCAVIIRPDLHRKCKNGHILLPEKDLRIFPDYKENSYGCDECQRLLPVVHFGVLHCGECGYDVCIECALKK